MKQEQRKKKIEHFAHTWVKIERTIPDLNYYYYQCSKCYQVSFPIPELQKLIDYSKIHQFMFVQDWILALLYVIPKPIPGITSFEKQIFLILMEFAQEENIPTENPGFRAYNFGPYTERIEDVIIGLEDLGALSIEGRKGANGEYFSLTDEGRQLAESSFNKLTKRQQERLRDYRLLWQEWGPAGLMKYVYRKYREYRDKSIVLDRVLHRRRLGKLVWEETDD